MKKIMFIAALIISACFAVSCSNVNKFDCGLSETVDSITVDTAYCDSIMNDTIVCDSL